MVQKPQGQSAPVQAADSLLLLLPLLALGPTWFQGRLAKVHKGVLYIIGLPQTPYVRQRTVVDRE